MQETKTTPQKRSVIARIGRGIGIFILSLIGLVVLILILIQTAPVQNFAREKIVGYLQNKLKTRVEIKRLDIDFPKMLVLEGVYFEDKKRDTLLAGNQLKVDIDMLKLLHSEIQINEINLNGIIVKVKRQLPDTVFNYQFIADAFSSPKDTTVKDTTAMKIAVNKIIIDKTRLVYLDAVTGNDVDIYLNHFDTRIKTIDLANLTYDVPSVVLNGVTGRIRQTKPLAVTAVVSAPNPATTSEPAKFINFSNKETLLSNVDIVYINEVSVMSTHIAFKNLDIHPESFDLKNSVVAVKDITLNGLNGFFKTGSPANTKVVKLTNETGKEVPVQALPWKFTVGSMKFDNNNFVYDDNTQPAISKGMDYAHLNIKDLTLHADSFLFHDDTIAANITEGSMKEKSGFVLNKFQTNVVYTDKGASLQNILIQTPGSEIKKSAVVRYPSIAAIQKEMGLLEMDIDLDNSYLQVKDIITFVPTMASQPAFKNPSDKIFLTARLKGSLDNLVVNTFRFRGLKNTSIDVSGVIKNAMDPNHVGADLTVRKFNTTSIDIGSIIPPGTLPAGISLPASISLKGKIKGNAKRLEIEGMQFTDTRNTTIDIAGVITDANDPKKVNADLNIRRISMNKAEIIALAPPGSIPSNITLPEGMTLTGKIKGGMKNAFADLTLNTSLGSVKIKGTISHPVDSIKARYNAVVSTSNLNLGTIMQQPQNVGKVTASFSISGRGYTPDRTDASIKGTVQSAEVLKYVYQNLNLNASLADQKFTANASVKDPNIDMTLQASGDMSGNLPGFTINADIDSVKTRPLHLTTDAIYYHGKIVANVPELNLDALNGTFDIVNSVLVMNGQRIVLDSLSAAASYEGGEQVISLKTDFVNAVVKGQYKLQQLGDIMIDAVQPYYAIAPAGKLATVDPYNFTIDATVTDHPTLHAFAPDLKRFDGVNIHSNFTSTDGWKAHMTIPFVLYGTNTIDNFVLDAVAANNALKIKSNINKISSGTSIVLYNTGINASLTNNVIDFGLSIKDKNDRDKYRLAGVVSQEPDSVYSFSLKPDSLMLNYASWSINKNNLLRYGTNLISARNFDLSEGNQHLIINSVNSTPESPVDVKFQDFRIATLSAFVQPDTLLVDGVLNGTTQVKDILKQPNFIADLTLNNLTVKKDTVGDINIKVNNNTANVFATNVSITGKGNDVSLTGNYYLKPADSSSFDFNLNIKQLPLKTLEAASMGSISNSTGNLTGQFAINGTVASPHVDGGLNFNKTGFNLAMLGSYFTVDGETIKMTAQGIKFDTFTIKDSANNSLVLDGLAATANFKNYDLDLTLKAKNFRAINTTKVQNSLYYGKLFFNSNLKIQGTEIAPSVDGTIRINENTDLAIVLPQAEPGLIDRKGIIEFVDMSNPTSDSIFKQTLFKYDSSFNQTAVTGMDVSVNIEVVKEANFNIIVDESNGDFLNIKGAAVLNAGIDPSGKINMTGSYIIDGGAYDLSFNFIHRKFLIQQGSSITWTGEPTTANIDVTCVYVANTSALDLVQDQITDNTQRGYYQQKLPFQVKLKVKGQLLQPELSFDIDLPTENNARVSNEILTTVNTRLEQIRAEPSELNKQVFALLLLNRFVGQDPFESAGGGGGFNATSFAKQSVSKILTEQLNRLAGDLIKGVDISFDVNSADDYTTGQRRDRTDFNVALSKRLLNDRLKVTVGSNYELEGPQQSNQTASNVIGNVSLDYSLSKDGRYLLRGYRKNDYEAVVEGYVIETGLKFIITLDYNKFKDIFKKRRRSNKSQQNAPSGDGKTNTGDAPTGKVKTPGDSTLADDKKTIPAATKDSTDEN